MKKEQKQVEAMALKPIGEDERKDWVSLAFVQAGICVCVPAFLLGAYGLRLFQDLSGIWSLLSEW